MANQETIQFIPGKTYKNLKSGKRFECKSYRGDGMVEFLDLERGTSFSTKVFNLKNMVLVD